MTRWEYRTLSIQTTGLWAGKIKVNAGEVDAALNTMGCDGWELVGIIAPNDLYGKSSAVLYTFKRPLP